MCGDGSAVAVIVHLQFEEASASGRNCQNHQKSILALYLF